MAEWLSDHEAVLLDSELFRYTKEHAQVPFIAADSLPACLPPSRLLAMAKSSSHLIRYKNSRRNHQPLAQNININKFHPFVIFSTAPQEEPK